MSLIPYLGWLSPTSEHVGRYRDSNGRGICGLYIRNYKQQQVIYVLNNGHVMCRYKYPQLTIDFRSPMVR